MPRTGKGGNAQGNRTDLNTALPKESAGSKGREYGSRTQDMERQDAVPMRPPPQPPPARLPGDRGGLGRMTERRDEPITSGIDLGEGPGSEALRLGRQAVARRQKRQKYRRLHDIAQRTGDPFINNILRKVGN